MRSGRPPVIRHRWASAVALVILTAGLIVATGRPAAAGPNDLGTVAGGAGATGSAMSTAMAPRGLAVFGNLMYVADPANDVVRKVDLTTSISSPVAGTAAQGFSGDGGPATLAQLADPTGVAVNASGDVFIADSANHRIRKVTVATGVITTVAGSGVAGFAGDNGQATSALLNTPRALTFDSGGIMIIVDSDNGRIRKVNLTTGVITHYRAGWANIRGIAVDGAGNLYVTEHSGNKVTKITTTPGVFDELVKGGSGFAGDGGPAVSARITGPVGIEIDSAGNLYFADSLNHRVRKITTATGIITTVAGNGTAGLLGDGAAATAARLNVPSDVALDAAGDLYIGQYATSSADIDRSPVPSAVRGLVPNYAGVRKVDVSQVISTVAGNGWVTYAGDGGAATDAQLDRPAGVVADAVGNTYFADAGNHRVRRISAGGVITTVAGSGVACGVPCNHAVIGDGGAATSAHLYTPMAVALNTAGDLYISDNGHHRIRRVDNATGVITTIAGTGTAGSGGDAGAATAATINLPLGLVFAGDGSLYFADSGSFKIRRITAGGTMSTVAGTGVNASAADGGLATASTLAEPRDVKIGPTGELYIAEYAGNRIRTVTAGLLGTAAGTGVAGSSGDGGAATSALLNRPVAMTFDNLGNLYVAEEVGRVVRRIDINGFAATVAGVAGGGTLIKPNGLVFSLAGDLLIADQTGQRVRSLAASTGVAIWWSSDVTTGHAAARYNWQFHSRTPATVAAVTMTVPTGTGGTLSVSEVYGLPAGGSVSLVGTTVTYTLPVPISLAAGIEMYVAVNGFTNTVTDGTYASAVTTLTGTGVTADVSTSNTLAFSAVAAPVVTPVVVRTAGFTTSVDTETIELDPSAPLLTDREASTTLGLSTNAPLGYSLGVGAATLSSPSGSIPAASGSLAIPIAPGAFPTNAWGYTAGPVSGTGIGVRQGGLATGAYVGYTPAGEAAIVASGPTGGDVVTLTNRVKIDYLTAAGTYTSTVTYTLAPAYE
jgi:sugar lactone lactonase YvrE